MRKPNLLPTVGIILILLISTQELYGFTVIGAMTTVLSNGATVGKFLWDHETPAKLENISLYYLSDQLTNMNKYLETLILQTSYEGNLQQVLNDLKGKALKIDTDLKTTMDYLKFKMADVNSNEITRREIIEFARSSINSEPGQPFDNYDTLRVDVVTKLAPALQDINALLGQKFQFTCSKFEHNLASHQQKILDVLQFVKLAELKVFLTLKGSAKLLIRYELGKKKDIGNYKPIIKQKVDRMKQWYKEILEAFQPLIHTASSDVWRCDAVNQQEGKTYSRLENVFNKYIINEKDMENGCPGTCERERTVEQKCSQLNDESVCLFARYCDGTLHECKALHDVVAYNSVTGHSRTCVAKNQTGRRYDSISTSDYPGFANIKKQTIGPKSECPEGQHLSFDQNYDYILEVESCDMCMCTCDDQVPYKKKGANVTSERYFYGDSMVSDGSRNYVITGIKLKKYNGVTYFEIEHGKLLPEGRIDKDTRRWIAPTEDELHKEEARIALDWDHREIELQDIDLPAGHALIGLQLIRQASRLKLVLFSKPFNFTSGKLLRSWDEYPTESTGKPLNETLDLVDSKLPPLESPSTKVVTNRVLKFSTSDMMTDIGQTTLPYFDLQDVSTNEPIAIGGAGFYYKHAEGYAGYIGIKLKTYDISPHLVAKDSKDVKFNKLVLADGTTGIFLQ